MKKLMLLGGSKYLLPAINAAHELGAYVITVDNIPDNVAHKYSDAYVDASIIDKEKVLYVARKWGIDGIMSYATDPGVITEAYVAEKLGLPSSGPYESVCILQNKEKFRIFLSEHGFNVPKFRTYESVGGAIQDADLYSYPVIVKPIDSAGSKGVSKVEKKDDLRRACEYALKESLAEKRLIVEEFIEKRGFSSDTDSLSIDGRLVFSSFNDQFFDDEAINPYTPAGFLWPTTMESVCVEELKKDIQRLFSLLGMKTSIYNIETRVGINGKHYIMEMSPRAGGNRLAEVLKYATGQDIITAIVKNKLGIPIYPSDFTKPDYRGVWGEIIIHSNKNGKFESLQIKEELENIIVEKDIWVSKNDVVHEFTGANNTIGTIIFCTDSMRKALEIQNNVSDYIKVNVQ